MVPPSNSSQCEISVRKGIDLEGRESVVGGAEGGCADRARVFSSLFLPPPAATDLQSLAGSSTVWSASHVSAFRSLVQLVLPAVL